MSFWVLARKVNGRPIIDGPHRTEEEATDWIIDNVRDQQRRNEARVEELATSDVAHATRILKHRLAKDVGVDEATRNALHPKGNDNRL